MKQIKQLKYITLDDHFGIRREQERLARLAVPHMIVYFRNSSSLLNASCMFDLFSVIAEEDFVTFLTSPSEYVRELAEQYLVGDFNVLEQR